MISVVWTNSIIMKMPSVIYSSFLTSLFIVCDCIYTQQQAGLSSLPLTHVGPGDGTRAIRLGSKFLYPLCHLTSPDTKHLPSKKRCLCITMALKVLPA